MIEKIDSSGYRQEKIIVSAVFLSLFMSVTGVHYTGTIFPSLPIGFLFAIGIITMISKPAKSVYIFSILLICGLATFYRVFVFGYPESLIGLDPDVYAMNIHWITQTGGLKAIDIWFYSDASAFLVLGALFGTIGGINAAKAMVFFPIAVGVVFPITVATITQRLTRNKQASIYAATITAVGSISIWLSYWPIPQTIGAVLWVLFFLSLVLYEDTGRKGLFACSALTLTTLTFTHKMPLILILASIALILLIHLVDSAIVRQTPFQYFRWVITATLVSAAIIIQWTFLTNYIEGVGFKITELLSTKSLILQSPLNDDPSHAISAFSGLYGIFIRRIHGFVLVPLGGIGWLYLLWKDTRNRIAWIVLATSAASVGFLALGVINPLATSPLRAVLMAEPFLAILVAIVITRAYSTSTVQWSRIASVVFAVILISQLAVVYVAPDHPSHARTYLSSEEVQGKQFGHEYIDYPIHADGYFSSERTPYEIERGIKNGEKYRSITGGLLNGTLTENEYGYIAYRTDVDVYRLTGGIWRLTWNPEIHLRTRYSKIYTNAGLDIYGNYT